MQATLTTAGMQTISATSGGVTGTSGTITVSPAETTHFAVTAPGAAVAGSSFGVTVTALDQYDNRNTTYDGTVNFTGTDPAATLPADSSLAAGTGTFSVTLRTTGSQTITGTETVSSSITGTSGPVTVTAPIPTVNPTPPVPTPDSGDNDDGFPSGTVSPATTGSGDLPLMTVTVNIGGDSKAWQAIVTGTKLSELIVTGAVQHGSGDNMTASPGIVYQYISLVPARYTSITKAVINFTVPQSWLDENHIAPGSIVLYHRTANGWEALPTTVLSAKDGTVYFSAESTAFSLFAIAGTPSAITPAIVAATQGCIRDVLQTPAPTAVAKAPVTTQTTAPPAASPQPSAPSPLLNIVLVIAAIGVLAGCGFMVRRWWIRRQNPALFREYD